MKVMRNERRQAWHALSRQDKHERLESMRERQQSQVELEMLRLRSHIR